jgi:hypothetical protein
VEINKSKVKIQNSKKVEEVEVVVEINSKNIIDARN